MFIVADIKTIFKSSRCSRRQRRMPRRKSPWRCLSWTSSRTMTLYCDRWGSDWICRSKRPNGRKKCSTREKFRDTARGMVGMVDGLGLNPFLTPMKFHQPGHLEINLGVSCWCIKCTRLQDMMSFKVFSKKEGWTEVIPPDYPILGINLQGSQSRVIIILQPPSKILS